MKTMSEEFKRVATKEVNEEIESISKILQDCNDDLSVTKKATMIQKHVHKIKGLAPMMGQEEIGVIAALNDKILKHLIEGNNLKDVFEILSESNNFMKNCMQGSRTLFNELKQKIETKYSKMLS